ncbi:MAG TPA: hypothetical protein DIW82_01160 [Corynebacterium nuruki]|uniref:HTH-type transcriptional regulator MT1864/Rv1816-like C-terminal domain-containing protein n=1 Tax=Corynebacterium nuruki TaxID=1032851 RepID=A0A3D4SWD7_9CORY|nr:hypothetical protein [Corynebacterium nuruki]
MGQAEVEDRVEVELAQGEPLDGGSGPCCGIRVGVRQAGGEGGALGVACMERFVDRQRAAVAAASNGRDALRDQGIAYVRYAAEEPHAFELIFDPTICPPGNPGPGTAELVKENLAMLASCVARAQEEGLFAGSDTAEVSTAMWGTVHGLAHLVNEGHLDLDAAVTCYPPTRERDDRKPSDPGIRSLSSPDGPDRSTAATFSFRGVSTSATSAPARAQAVSRSSSSGPLSSRAGAR